jgi:hypothetical protein
MKFGCTEVLGDKVECTEVLGIMFEGVRLHMKDSVSLENGMHNEELHSLASAHCIIAVVESKRLM